MITSLYIKDFALIDELDVAFHPGLSILTGQTGAGKSIIIGALHMILGERADTDVIREGSDKAIAEAIFRLREAPGIRLLLEENEIEWRDELILRREIRQSGSRGFVNDTPVTISLMKQIGDFLVDLHGQHDHQLLLREEEHQRVLDQQESVRSPLEAWRKSYQQTIALRREIRELKARENALKEKSELYRFQLQELEAANLREGEEEELEHEMSRLDNAEELDIKASGIVEIGEGDEIAALDLLTKMEEMVNDLARLEPEFETYRGELRTARISIQEAIRFAERYRGRIEFNPERLEELRRRQSQLNKLQKKYQRDLPSLLELQEQLRDELDQADRTDMQIEKLESSLAAHVEDLADRARKLKNAREKVGNELAREIESRLRELGIPHPSFDVQSEWIRKESGWLEIDGQPVDATADGADRSVFLISTNKGESPKPLARIASGGEVSRVMLALKSILARNQQMPVMVFDEIDTGISGSISEKVGQVMRQLSRHCQILAITHQPQIASHADQHYQVHKEEDSGRTVSRITRLSESEHIQEVAGLMSGETITKSALQSARELIESHRS
ncbi:MAG: DNA repair protein RecN [Bacteroidota bacterium]